MNTDPVIHADKHHDAAYAYEERLAKAERVYAAEVLQACRQGDANAFAHFAPPTTDWGARASGAWDSKRTQTLAEVLEGELNYGKGPSMTQVMQLVINLAYSAQPQAVMAQQARDLLGEMAHMAAVHTVEVED